MCKLSSFIYFDCNPPSNCNFWFPFPFLLSLLVVPNASIQKFVVSEYVVLSCHYGLLCSNIFKAHYANIYSIDG